MRISLQTRMMLNHASVISSQTLQPFPKGGVTVGVNMNTETTLDPREMVININQKIGE